MTDKEEVTGAGDNPEMVLSGKKSGKASLLDSGEDFEMLDDDIDDDPPPLEDAGGGKKTKTEEPAEDQDTGTSAPLDEWMDILGNKMTFSIFRLKRKEHHWVTVITIWHIFSRIYLQVMAS